MTASLTLAAIGFTYAVFLVAPFDLSLAPLHGASIAWWRTSGCSWPWAASCSPATEGAD